MAALKYLLEFGMDSDLKEDPGVFIHIQTDPPDYQKRVTKETYMQQDESLQTPFVNEIFGVAGITEVSSSAYRVWVSKSPAYQWNDVLQPLLTRIANMTGFDSIEELPGSGREVPNVRARRAP